MTNAEKPFSVLLRFPKISYLTSKCLATSHGGLFDAYGECAVYRQNYLRNHYAERDKQHLFLFRFSASLRDMYFCIIHICLRAQSTLLVLVIDKYVNNIYCHASLKYNINNISKLMF